MSRDMGAHYDKYPERNKRFRIDCRPTEHEPKDWLVFDCERDFQTVSRHSSRAAAEKKASTLNARLRRGKAAKMSA